MSEKVVDGIANEREDVYMPTVREIVKEWLEKSGYDGLFAEDECACPTSDLMPCDEGFDRCSAGYRSECGSDCGEHEYHISEKKPEVKDQA